MEDLVLIQPMPAKAELRESQSVTGRDEAARFHHLDALRGFALLLGVVFHAAASFVASYHAWAITDSKPSVFLEWFFFGCHSFRLELFFIMAGFFARLLILRRGTAGFVRNRIQRILMPLAAGWFILYPLLVYLWLWGMSVSGGLAKAGVPAQLQQTPLWMLLLGFFASGGFLQKFDLTHPTVLCVHSKDQS
jgi:uncharacterized membrane protein